MGLGYCAEAGDDMALNDRDRRVLADIARQVRAEDPDFAAVLTGSRHRPEPDWTPIWLRVLALLLLTVGVLASAAVLVLAAFAVFGIAQLTGPPSLFRPSTARGDDEPGSPHG
jgi:Protein of unknown function (DUF3040)